jgi:DNA-binding MarR family transcriptional regulator
MRVKSNPEEHRSVLLHKIGFMQDKVVDVRLREKTTIGLSQFKIIYSINEMQGCSQCQIARSLGLTEAAVSRQIALMEQSGLVEVGVSEVNLRAKTVVLTSRGLKTMEEAWRVVDDVDHELWREVSVDDKALAQKTMAHIVKRLETMCDCEPPKI